MKHLNRLIATLMLASPLVAHAQEAAPSPEATPASARPSDSNDTRLLLSPTGRPLGKGEGYFSDHYVFFPSVTYGLTNHLSIGGGVSALPGLGLSDQLFYATSKLGRRFSENLAVSGGALYAQGGEGEDAENLGVGFAMATFGKPDRSLTLGGGVARRMEWQTTGQVVRGRVEYETRRRGTNIPVIIAGGTLRLSRHLSLVSENWLVLHEGFRIEEQPFALGIRFQGDRLSADVGAIVVGELIDEGFPVPWLSITYHFGKKK